MVGVKDVRQNEGDMSWLMQEYGSRVLPAGDSELRKWTVSHSAAELLLQRIMSKYRTMLSKT